MAELVDALDLGSSVRGRVGSSPTRRTIANTVMCEHQDEHGYVRAPLRTQLCVSTTANIKTNQQKGEQMSWLHVSTGYTVTKIADKTGRVLVHETFGKHELDKAVTRFTELCDENHEGGATVTMHIGG